jgi:hypothetical protein
MMPGEPVTVYETSVQILELQAADVTFRALNRKGPPDSYSSARYVKLDDHHYLVVRGEWVFLNTDGANIAVTDPNGGALALEPFLFNGTDLYTFIVADDLDYAVVDAA